MFDAAKRNRINTYIKKKECLQCKYYFVCDGIEHDQEVFPEDGEKVLL
jgi:radical SAM protein with 4Fe4S-binding SPASM domain